MKRTMSAEPFTITLTGGAVSPSGYIRIGHGTDINSANYISVSGVSYEMAVQYGGGGTFWATEDLQWAGWCAVANPAGGQPALVLLDLPLATIEEVKNASALTEHANKTLEFHRQCFNLLNQSMINVTVQPITFTA
jgi:hypothetical protein